MSRFLAALNGRYTLRQSALILLPTIAALLIAQSAMVAAGISGAASQAVTFVATFGTFFTLATVINRRTRA
jgi:uncharacterized membrane protein